MNELVKHKSQRSETRQIGEVRVAFIFAHEKRTKTAAGTPLKSPRNDMLVLMPKIHPEAAQCPNYKLLAEMCMEAANKEPAWGGWPAGGKWPIQDGDIPYTPKPKPGQPVLTPVEVAAKYPWRRGHWIFEVSSNLEQAPKVALLQNGVPVEIPSKVINGQSMYKSGDYGFVSMQAYTFQRETWGVNFGFEGVLFTRPGDPIGSSGPRSATQMFGNVVGMAAPSAPVAPGAAPLPPGVPSAAPQPQYAAPVAPPAPPAPVASPPLAPAPQ